MQQLKIVGVTKCPTGIAHTYMAAERLEKTGEKLGYKIQIETQGSQGTENLLSKREIEEADYVIIAADIAVDGVERFAGKKVLKTPIKPVLRNTEKVFASLENEAVTMEKTQGEDEENIMENVAFPVMKKGEQVAALQQLMNGASYMIPFVVVGGMFIAFSLTFGSKASVGGMVVFSDFWHRIKAIGDIAFAMMYPVLSGFLAFSIAGRATFAPAMIGAMIAMDGELLGTGEGTGFLGCIVVGYLVGYLVKWMNTWKVPKAMKPMMPIFIIPLLGVALTAFVFICILGKPIALMMSSLNHMLVVLSASPQTAILLGLVLGAMVGVDMGGPINKVAFFFGVASIAEGNPQIMGIASTAIAVAPMSMGIASLVDRKKFSKEEQSAGFYTIFMGVIGISEGAIPFAIADPGNVIPSVVLGSAVAGAAAAVAGITSSVPHGGFIIGLLGATNYVLRYFLCILLGVAVSVILVLFLKGRNRKEKQHK